jgi:hypothetical protein
MTFSLLALRITQFFLFNVVEQLRSVRFAERSATAMCDFLIRVIRRKFS